jgi:catechol 2,3-dioxygenase-like lactoylglutathione lyase family enzyme
MAAGQPSQATSGSLLSRLMRVHHLDHIVLNVSDVERSLAWYTDLLGLWPERVDEWRDGRAPFPSVRVDEGCIIDLFGVEPNGENLNHLCLVVEPGDVEQIAADDRFDVVDGPARRWGARGDGLSVYVRDPDGNVVELRSYT